MSQTGKIFLEFHVTDLDCWLNFRKVRDVAHNFAKVGRQRRSRHSTISAAATKL